MATQPADSSPVIHLVTDAKGNVLHEVHVRMQELPITEAKSPDTEVGAVPLGVHLVINLGPGPSSRGLGSASD